MVLIAKWRGNDFVFPDIDVSMTSVADVKRLLRERTGVPLSRQVIGTL